MTTLMNGPGFPRASTATWLRPAATAVLLLSVGLAATRLAAAPGAASTGADAARELAADIADLVSPRDSGADATVSIPAPAVSTSGSSAVEETARALPSVRDVTPQFARELEAAHLWTSPGGARLLTSTVGVGSPKQLVLAQDAAVQFGIVENPFFDPLRAAVIRDGEALADLSTGVILGHPIGSPRFGSTEVIPQVLLDELRARVGWTVASARLAQVELFERLIGYVPVSMRTDEAFAASLERARANYEALAAAG